METKQKRMSSDFDLVQDASQTRMSYGERSSRSDVQDLFRTTLARTREATKPKTALRLRKGQDREPPPFNLYF